MERNFGKRLKELRTERKLTIRDMGNILEMSHQTYVKYEQNLVEPPLVKLHKLADYFKVTTDYLLGRTDY